MAIAKIVGNRIALARPTASKLQPETVPAGQRREGGEPARGQGAGGERRPAPHLPQGDAAHDPTHQGAAPVDGEEVARGLGARGEHPLLLR